MNRKSITAVVFLALIIGGIWLTRQPASEAVKSNASSNLKTVRFANLPYADHCITSIGVKKGFFQDAGINLEMESIKVEEAIPSLVNGRFDAISIPPGIIFSSHESAPNVIAFVFSDLFQGYALLAQPNAGYQSYATLVASGKSHQEAVKAVVQQIKGKTFAYPAETAIKPFIEKLLSDGSVSSSDFKSLVLEDPLTVASMRKKEADFQVGGVPSRLQLEKEGYVVLISASDLAKGAKPSSDSSELAAILQNCWATTREFAQKEPDTVLRMAGVNYRIMQFIKDHETEAAAIHMDYLTKTTGQQFTQDDARVIYHSLDPFVTFEEQNKWFNDQSSPFYFAHVNGAILKSFITQGIYKKSPPSVDDVIFADDTYRDLQQLRTKTEQLVAQLTTKQLSESALKLIEVSKQKALSFDFVGALKAAEEAANTK